MNNTLIRNNYIYNWGSDPYNQGNVGADGIDLAYAGSSAGLWTRASSKTNTTISGNVLSQMLPGATKSLILLQNVVQNIVISKNYFYGKPAVSAIDHTGPEINETIENNIFQVNPTSFEGILRFYTDQDVYRGRPVPNAPTGLGIINAQ